MVRTRNFDPADALNRVVELFAVKGYEDTSMEDIVKATGVSRYGLYGSFGNKRELFERALERYADRMGRQSFLKLLEPGASLADIRAIFEEWIGWICDGSEIRGCMICSTAMAVAPQDSEIQAVLQRFLRRMSKTFAVGLETAKGKGEARADLDVAAAGDYLTAQLFGLSGLARSGFPRETLERHVDTTMTTVGG